MLRLLRYVKNEKLVPFGIGKRYCMGELLARNELILFLGSLLHQLHFLPPQQHPPPSPHNYIANMTRMPQDYYVRVVPNN